MASTDRMYKPMVSTVGKNGALHCITQQVELLCNRLKINAVSVQHHCPAPLGVMNLEMRRQRTTKRGIPKEIVGGGWGIFYDASRNHLANRDGRR